MSNYDGPVMAQEIIKLRAQLAKATRYSVDADRSLNLMALTIDELKKQLAYAQKVNADQDKQLMDMAMQLIDKDWPEAKLNLKIDNLQSDLAQMRLHVDVVGRQLVVAQSKLSLATEALEVYASESNWHERTHCGGRRFHDGQGIVMGHDHAREALAKLNVAANDTSTKHVDETEKLRHVPDTSLRFFIRKTSRPGAQTPYRGPTCLRAEVVPGKWYTDRTEAQKDAELLADHNPVGFEVIEESEKDSHD